MCFETYINSDENVGDEIFIKAGDTKLWACFNLVSEFAIIKGPTCQQDATEKAEVICSGRVME